MARRKSCGCDEYRTVSRRNFMQLSASAAAAAAMPAWLPRVALAQSDNSSRDVIVSVFLRGGADGLTLCVPHGDNDYYDLRPTIAVPRPDSGQASRAIDLDGFFGLPRAFESLLDIYQSEEMLVVHATGLENPTKSHFEAMHFMEVGQGNPPPAMFTGWLGRHLAATPPLDPKAPLRGVGLGYGLQRTLVGAPKTLPVEDLADFGYAGDPSSERGRVSALTAMYAAQPGPFQTAAAETVDTVDLLRSIDFEGYRPGSSANYPDDEFGYALRSCAALIKSDVGVEALAVDLEGWDTHEYQGPLQGYMFRLMERLARGLSAFHTDLGNRNDVTVVVMSEFGRNAFENGSRGTDHGHAGAMMLFGRNVVGGRVLADWPGLSKQQLYIKQDLAITTDYRDVLSEVLEKRADSPNVGAVFPDPSYARRTLGVVK